MTAEEREEWHRDQEALAREAAEGHARGTGATETDAEAEKVLPDPARVARHVVANYNTSDGVKWLWSCVCGVGDTVEFVSAYSGVTYGVRGEVGALLAKAALDRHLELAALVAERDGLRAEVEGLRGEVKRVRALADAFADDGLMRHGGNVAWHIEEAIASEKCDFPDAADRRIASQRERAEAAEAKLARVEALHRHTGRPAGGYCEHDGDPWLCDTAAALADAPAEQRDEPCPSCERDLTYPGQQGHECYTHADRLANIRAAEQRAEGGA